jgi:hypothetical protein
MARSAVSMTVPEAAATLPAPAAAAWPRAITSASALGTTPSLDGARPGGRGLIGAGLVR